jgi:hypothetical protein
MYLVNVKEGKQSFPPKFVYKVRHWLGDNDGLMKEVYNQVIVSLKYQFIFKNNFAHRLSCHLINMLCW